MPVEYYLRDYALTPEPGDFIAAIVDKGTASMDVLAQTMIQQGCPLTADEIQFLFKDLQRAAQALLNQGYVVTSPLSMVSPTIQGVFNGEDDEFDPRRHKLQLTTIANPDLEENWQSTVEVTKVYPRREM